MKDKIRMIKLEGIRELAISYAGPYEHKTVLFLLKEITRLNRLLKKRRAV